MKKITQRYKGTLNPRRLQRNDYIEYIVGKDRRIYKDVRVIGNILSKRVSIIHIKHREGKSILTYYPSERIKAPLILDKD